jgi:methenyltetrahydromethanopterin cyclohydrolase
VLVDLLDDEEVPFERVCVRMLVAAAGVEPEKVSDTSRKESIVGSVNIALQRQARTFAR